MVTINVPRIKKCLSGRYVGQSSGGNDLPLQIARKVPNRSARRFFSLDLSYPAMPVRGEVDMMGRYDVPPSTAGIP